MTVVLCHKFTGVNWLLVTVSCFETKCLLKVTESFCNREFSSVVSKGQEPKEVEVEDVSYYEAGCMLSASPLSCGPLGGVHLFII